MEVSEEHIADLRARAWSFREFSPPNNAIKVAEEIRCDELYEYYEDLEGNVWYQTETNRRYKERIQAWEKQKKKR